LPPFVDFLGRRFWWIFYKEVSKKKIFHKKMEPQILTGKTPPWAIVT
jgi:hypothetical protein